MNIDTVKIKNFRNYLGEHEFVLNKTITILYGSNGFGKSSFFDAIEWCLTGDISRYDKTFERKSVINHNCDFENAECCVEIVFGGNVLSRSFKIVNREYRRETIKINTNDGNVIRGKENVDVFLKHTYAGATNSDLFGNLIKQSHILSQDQVTDFISKDDPKERFNSLADIMGLKNVLYMYENFKEIQNEVKNSKSKLEDKEQRNFESIQLRSKDLIPIESELLIEIQNVIQQIPDVQTLEKVLPTIEQEKIALKHQINQAKHVLKDVEKKGYLTISGAKENANAQRANIRSVEEHIEKLKQLNSRVKSLHNNLTQKTELMEEATALTVQVKEKNDLLKVFGFSESTQIIDIANAAEPKRDQLSSLVFAIASKAQYQSLLQTTQRAGELTALENKDERLLNKMTRLDGVIASVLVLLNDDEIGVIAKLLNDLSNIQEYVVKHNSDGKCPVCSADHGEHLQTEINHNINKYQMLVSENASAAAKLMDKKNRFEARKHAIEIEMNKSKSEKNELQLLIENAQQQLEVIKSNSLFKVDLFDIKSHEEINKENDLIKNELKQLDDTITIIKEVNQLKNKLITKLNELGTQHVGDLSQDAIVNRRKRLQSVFCK